jgi:hypothetical protein
MQLFPGGFGQRGVRTDNVTDHIPRGQVERAFRSRSHGKRNRTLRAEGNALGGRFLPRANADGLRKEIDGDRLVARFELSITAQTIAMFQKQLPQDCRIDRVDANFTFSNAQAAQQVCRKIPVICGLLAGCVPLVDGTKLWSSQIHWASRTLQPWV